MESLGGKLHRSREDKGYSLDQVARDTHITKRFLEALEQENFSLLPGESYIVGFLRSYSEFLGLNPEEMVALYKNIKIQEEPAPMSQLLEKQGMSIAMKAVLVFGSLVVLGMAAFFIYSIGKDDSKIPEAVVQVSPSDQKLVNFEGTVLERSFADADVLRFPMGNGFIDMALGYKGDKATLNLNGNLLELSVGREWPLDVNQDGTSDLRVFVRNIDSRSSPVRILMRLDRIVAADSIPQTPESIAAQATADAAAMTDDNTAGILASVPTGVSPVGNPKLPSRKKSAQSLAEFPAAGPISFQLAFSQPSYFRYLNDSGKKEERFSSAGEVLTLSGAAWVRVWIADSSRASFRVAGKEISAGANGEVSAWQFGWEKTAAGANALTLQAMY